MCRVYQSKLAVVLSNWLTQGMVCMLPGELIVKCGLELIYFAVFVWMALLLAIPWSYAVPPELFVAHTANWITNGHFFNLMRFCRPRFVDRRHFLAYPLRMRGRMRDKQSISAVALFGSLSRRQYSGYSDLDVRIVARDGLWNQLNVGLLVWRERLIALVERYPLEIL